VDGLYWSHGDVTERSGRSRVNAYPPKMAPLQWAANNRRDPWRQADSNWHAQKHHRGKWIGARRLSMTKPASPCPPPSACHAEASDVGGSVFYFIIFPKLPLPFPVVDKGESFSVKKRQLANAPELDELIREVRGQKVMLDTDLARIYGIPTFRFNETIKRNRERFPEDFMFRLTGAEVAGLTSQFAISKKGRGGRRTLPYAFTEHGAIMAANVLNSPRAAALLPATLAASPPTRAAPARACSQRPTGVQMNTTCGDAVGWTALVAW